MKAILETKYRRTKDYYNMTRLEKLYWISRLKPINDEDFRCQQLLKWT